MKYKIINACNTQPVLSDLKPGEFFGLTDLKNARLYQRGHRCPDDMVECTEISDGNTSVKDGGLKVYPVRIVSEPIEFEFV